MSTGAIAGTSAKAAAIVDDSGVGGEGADTGAAGAPQLQSKIEEELNKQLDTLATLTYPNSSIRYAAARG